MPPRHGRHAAPENRGSTSATVVLLVVVLAVVVAGGVIRVRFGDPAPAPGAMRSQDAAPAAAGTGSGDQVERRQTRGGQQARDAAAAREVLRRWDARRAAAYAAGSVRALRRLYVPGSVAGRRDADLLRGYLRRGYRIEGMSTHVLALRVAERRPDRWVLRVTDRLHSAVAVRHGRRVRLPADGASTRVVAFARAGHGWRVASVRDAG